MANENGWGDGAVNNNIGWGQGSLNNNISWGKSHIDSWSGATDIDGGNAPVNTVAPVISGSTSLSSVLTTTNGTWTSLTAITYTYQWYRGATLITGATNSTYTIVVADSGLNITCQVTATNLLGSASANSNAITAQTFTAPINTVAPALSGTAQEGQTLTCSTGTWTGNPTPTYIYQWKRNGSNIGSATNSTYTLVTADVGQSIKCTVTATNAISAVNADSNTVTPTSSVDADAQAFITAAAITDPTQQSAVNKLVVDLKGYGVWSKMKAVYPFIGGTASAHKFNLKDPRNLDAAFRLVFNGGWTHNSNGATPNGTNGYANTYLNAYLYLSVNNSAHGAYLRSVGTGGLGLWTGESSRFDILFNSSSLRYSAIGNAGQVNNNDVGSGFVIGSRTANNSNKLYRNGTLKVTSTATNTASNLGPNFLYSIGNAGAGSNLNFDSSNYAFNFISDGLSDTEAANLYTAVQTFNTALNRNV